MLSATAFGLSMYSILSQQGHQERQPNTPSSGITLYEFLQDLNPDPNLEGYNFISYNPGDTITIVDTVSYVNYSDDTIYGSGTTIILKSTRLTNAYFHLVMEGDKRSDYQVGQKITLTPHISSYTINKGEYINEDLDEYPLFIRAPSPDAEKLQDGSFKYTYKDTPYYPSLLANCTAKLYLDTNSPQKKVVDSMNSLADGSSSGGKIRFYDANNSGKLDYGDYFIVSGIKTSSKYEINYYLLDIEESTSGYCWGYQPLILLLGWYK